MQGVLNIVDGNKGNMNRQAAVRISEAVLQFTYRNCPIATRLNLEHKYTCALLRVHISLRNEDLS